MARDLVDDEEKLIMETRVRQNEADCKEVSDKASEMMRATRTLSNRIINNKIFDFTLFL